MSDKEEGEKTIAQDIVVTKYKMAGEMVNREYIYTYIHSCLSCVCVSSCIRCQLHVDPISFSSFLTALNQ